MSSHGPQSTGRDNGTPKSSSLKLHRRRHRSTSSSSSSESTASSDTKRRSHKRHASKDGRSHKVTAKKRKRHRRASSTSSTDTSRKSKKCKSKKKKKRKHKKSKKSKTTDVNLVTAVQFDDLKTVKSDDELIGPAAAAMNVNSMKPMSKEEWEEKQSFIRKVYDPETGRHRLIRGENEVLEEIVSHHQHKEINKKATEADGAHFQAKLGLNN